MKKTIILATLFLFVASANMAMAQPKGKGAGIGARTISNLNLTADQYEKIRAMREAHMKEMIPVRTQLYSKRAELRLLWMQTNPDAAKIKAKQKELSKLREQVQEKNTDLRLAFRTILTPEQLSQYLAQGGGKGCVAKAGRRGFRGQGQGQGMVQK